MTFRH